MPIRWVVLDASLCFSVFDVATAIGVHADEVALSADLDNHDAANRDWAIAGHLQHFADHLHDRARAWQRTAPDGDTSPLPPTRTIQLQPDSVIRAHLIEQTDSGDDVVAPSTDLVAALSYHAGLLDAYMLTTLQAALGYAAQTLRQLGNQLEHSAVQAITLAPARFDTGVRRKDQPR